MPPLDDLAFGSWLAVGGFIALAVGLGLYMGALHLTWAGRVRRLLEHEGFRVRHLERRWLTKGPFPDLRRAGLQHHNEWLVRVVADDQAGVARAGWVRWAMKRPWQQGDHWAVRWDEEPWSGLWPDAAGRRGLSSRAFLLPVMLIGGGCAIASVFVFSSLFNVNLSPWSTTPLPSSKSEPSRSSSAAATTDELRCRGGEPTSRLKHLESKQSTTGALTVVLSFEFVAAEHGATAGGAALSPGTCSWADRPLTAGEPRVIRFETPAIRTPGMPHMLTPMPGTIPSEDDLRDPTRAWRFLGVNASQGFLMATGPAVR